MADVDKSRAKAKQLLTYLQADRNTWGKPKLEEVNMVEKVKETHIIVKRINCNRFIVHNQIFDYLQLVNWFRDIVTE
jgi:hypothetical protein